MLTIEEKVEKKVKKGEKVKKLKKGESRRCRFAPSNVLTLG